MSGRKVIKDRLQELDPAIDFTLKFSCSMKWEEMHETDDSRCKHCEKCDLRVFDLVDLNPAEIDELLKANGGEICGQAYFRNDNRISFNECNFPKRILRGKIKPSFPNG